MWTFFGSPVDVLDSGSSSLRHRHPGDLEHRVLADMMAPGPRAGAMDRSTAICTAGIKYDLTVPMEETLIEYFYAIETRENITMGNVDGTMLVRDLEETLFHAINPAIVWCYYDESSIGKRLLATLTAEPSHHQHRMTIDEARRLSIVTFSTTPEDEETTIPCNFDTASEYCLVMKGMMTIIHHATSDVSLAKASIYDACQVAMDNSETVLIDGNKAFANITNIKWLGETEDDAINGGPLAPGGGGSNNRNTFPVIAYAVSVPLLILMALALFVARNKTRREAVITRQLLARDKDDKGALVGTGDPPRSFHEGMYHYTRHGARYLSTNCPGCLETKRNGFFTRSDLETIHEGNFESFEEISLMTSSLSGAGLGPNGSENNLSGHRMRNLVKPTDTALGVKHSSIDVHQCTSSTCPICNYRPANVAFVDRNADNQKPTMFGSTIQM